MQRRTALTTALTSTLTATLTATLPGVARALYDPRPHPCLAAAVGAWAGTLTYLDWSRPDTRVTLPCQLSVSLAAPQELALFFEFDDGPGKRVYSYERMAFDFAAQLLVWSTGIAKPGTSQHRITRAEAGGEGSQIAFERAVDDRIDRHVLAVGPKTLAWSKTEHAASGTATLRNAYALQRVGS